jgi:adenylosuccinate synthase
MQEENQMVTAVVGANWGDEGKGKITDMLADEADIVIRFQGGANAGHTIVNNYGKFALHTLPSGVFHSHITNIIGNGVALDIPKVMSEIKSITDRNVPAPKIMISDRAQMVMPYHVLFDQYEEERLGKNSFGSTKSGIAPFYSDKYAKIGFQVSELFDEELLQAKVKRTCETKNIMLERSGDFLQGVRSGKRVRFHVVHDPDRSCRLHDPLSYSKTDDNTACDPDRSDGHRLVILYAVFQ